MVQVFPYPRSEFLLLEFGAAIDGWMKDVLYLSYVYFSPLLFANERVSWQFRLDKPCRLELDVFALLFH